MKPAKLEREQVTELRLHNPLYPALKLRLEPWGEVLSIALKTTYKVVARGPDTDSLEIEVVEDGIVVHGWPGSVLSVFHDSEIVIECRVPVPSTPRVRLGH